MVSHYIVTNREVTSRKSANYISVNEKEFMRMYGYFNYSVKVIEDDKNVLIGENSAFSR